MTALVSGRQSSSLKCMQCPRSESWETCDCADPSLCRYLLLPGKEAKGGGSRKSGGAIKERLTSLQLPPGRSGGPILLEVTACNVPPAA